MKSLILAAMALCLGAAGAVAAPVGVPSFDLRETCRTAADSGGTTGGAPNGCMNDERTAKASITKLWGSFSPADRETCRRTAGNGDAPNSYVELLVCLTMARDARKVSP